MIQNIIATSFLTGLVTLIFITPYIFSIGIYKMEYGDVYKSDKILSFIPIVNMIRSEKLYTGKFSKVGLVSILFILSVLVRFIAVFLVPANMAIQIITVIFFIVAVIAIYVVNVWLVFMVLNDVGMASLLGIVVLSIIFPLGQYYIGTYLPTVVKNFSREEETFK